MRERSLCVIFVLACIFAFLMVPNVFAETDLDGTVWKGVLYRDNKMNCQITFEFEVGGAFRSTLVWVKDQSTHTFLGEWKQQGDTVTINIPKQQEQESSDTDILHITGDRMEGSSSSTPDAVFKLKKVPGGG